MKRLTPLFHASLPVADQIFSARRADGKQGRPHGAKDRTPRTTRAHPETRPAMVLTSRDVAILEAVYRYRVLSSEQIERLIFPETSSTQARLRLRLLFHHEYLYRTDQPQRRSEATKPFLYFLDRRGANELAALYGCDVADLDWNRGEHNMGFLHLPHLLLTNDVRIAITQSAEAHGYTLVEWRDEKTLRRQHRDDLVTITVASGAQQTTHVIPDGYVLLEVGNKRKHRFLEIDRATVTGHATSEQNRAWDKKILAYLAWYRSGKFQQRYATPAMGVLTITTSEERLHNLKRITEEAGARERFWFTCLTRSEDHDILADPLWSVATTNEVRRFVVPS